MRIMMRFYYNCGKNSSQETFEGEVFSKKRCDWAHRLPHI
jgi:hypothetical protein